MYDMPRGSMSGLDMLSVFAGGVCTMCAILHLSVRNYKWAAICAGVAALNLLFGYI